MLTPDKLNIELNRDIFTRHLIRELAGMLQEYVGMDQAKGYISLVGMEMGKWIEEIYKKAMKVETLNAEQVTEVLIDLKKRIKGDFYLCELTKDKIVLGNRCCPFEKEVKGHSSLCMVTSTVFGGIAARNLGYAKIIKESSIADGDPECRVVIYICQTEEAIKADGLEYFPEGKISL